MTRDANDAVPPYASPPIRISSVRVVPTPGGQERGCIATASMLINDVFRVRSMRVIRRRDGQGLMLAFPNVEVRRACGACATACGMTDRHCRMCGSPLDRIATEKDVHLDVAYPTTAACRLLIESAVFGAPEMAAITRRMEQESERSREG